MSDKLVTVSGAQTLYNDTRDRIENVKAQVDTKVGYATVEDGYLILKATEDSIEEIAKLTGFGGGGGGGGGSNPAILEVKNNTPWGRSTSISNSEDTCNISLYWTSLEGTQDTGDGTLVIKTSAQTLRTMSVSQGTVTVNVREFLTNGDNTLYFTISDIYGNSRTLSFVITVTIYYLESIFNDSRTFFDSENINFSYKPVGAGNKHMFFKIDGEIVGEADVVISGETEFFSITPEMWQTHGVHKLEAYFVDENGSKSNTLTFNLICAVSGDTRPIISTPFDQTTVKMYETLDIPFIIYNPTSLVSNVFLEFNGQGETRENIENNTEQHWSHRVMSNEPISMTIMVGETSISFDLTVSGSIIPISPVDGAVLYLSSAGRDNASVTRDIWKYEDIQAEFSGFSWTPGVDGWVQDKDGYIALTVKGDARVYIPYEMFKKNCTTDGKTIEFEFSTSDVNDYTATVISCFYGGRGLNITAQDVILAAEQTSLSTQFKEDEHVRISFVVDAEANNRLLLCYINAILSGVVEYKPNEDFRQANPVGISIGSSDVTTNVYNIRVYDRALSRREILRNWICDKQDADEMLEAYQHNDVFDKYQEIDVELLPKDLPYMVMFPQRTDGTHTLPQNKKDKIPCDGYYVDPLHPEKNFTFTSAEAAVQGTSSAGYPRKNYKIKFKKDKDPLVRPNFSWKNSKGEDIKKWAMNDDALPTTAFCFKADFASSEGANNVELVKLFNRVHKNVYKTPPQRYADGDTAEDKAKKDKIRIGIDGFPILIFYNNGETTTFLGKYNFNNDKSTEEIFGFADGDESWETTSNVSYLALWKDDELTTPDNPLKWTEAFEARFPDVGEEASIDKLQVISSWVKSTDCGNILRVEKDPDTGDDVLVDTGIPVWADESQTTIDPETGKPVYHGFALAEPVTYGDVTYTEDNKDYRHAKFRNELENYFNLNSTLFFYLFTELFLMVDSRAKNAFPTIFDKDGKWCWIPYDFDTAIGINNEGKLTFGYSLEDIDKVNNANVFNGQDSVIWCNLRDVFHKELENMYVRFNEWGINYDNVEKAFEEHQSKWPEAIFNEDAYFKYIQPYLENHDDYLEMCLGSKAEQRKWWLYNRFRYIDSKYRAGESEKAVIVFRAYSNSELNITPYADIYARFRMGGKNESPYAMERAFKNVPTTLRVNPGDNVDDLDCYIFSADQLKDIGDLSGFTPSTINLAPAIKLQRIKVGRATPNLKLTSLTLGNNVLLESINAINCPNLPSIDATNCTNLKELYLEGCSGLVSAVLPTGGMMTTLHLPANMQALTIKKQPKITDFQLEGYSQLTTLVLDTVSQEVQRDTLTILHNMPNGSRVQLYNVDTKFSSVAEFEGFIVDLNRMVSYDGTGPQEFIAQIIGKATIESDEIVDYEYIAEVNSRYTNLDIICNTKKTVKFYNPDGSEVVQQFELIAKSHFPSMTTYTGEEPALPDTETIHYKVDGWTTSLGGELVYPTNEIQGIVTSLDLYPHFIEVPIYTVNFLSYDGTLIEKTTTRPDLGSYVSFTESFPSSPSGFSVEFIGWGSAKYLGVDIETDETKRIISDVTESFDVFAQMSWAIEPNSIQMDSYPTKYNYYSGDFFDKTRLEVSVEKIIPSGTTRVPVAFTYDDVRFYDTDRSKDITVDENNVLHLQIGMATTLEVSKDPDAGYQEADGEVNFDGIEFKVTFSDITDYEPEDYKNFEIIDHVVDYEPIDFNSSSYAPQPSGDDDPVAAWASELTFIYRSLTCSYTAYIVRGDITDINNCDWTFISRMCNSGQAASTWSIGDTKIVKVDEVRDTSKMIYTRAAEWKVKILSFDHNIRYSEHNGEVFDRGDDHIYEYPEGKHTITFMFAESSPAQAPGSEKYPMSMYFPVYLMSHNSSEDMDKWRTAWDDTPGGGCPGQIYVHNLMYGLPNDLQSVIKEVTKSQAGFDYQDRMINDNTYFDNKRGANKLVSQREKLFIPSMYEMYGVNKKNDRQFIGVNESDGCARYDYFISHDTPQDRIFATQWSGSYTPLDTYLRTFVYQWANSSNELHNYYAYTSQNGLLVDSGTTMLTVYLNRGYIVCFNV